MDDSSLPILAERKVERIGLSAFNQQFSRRRTLRNLPPDQVLVVSDNGTPIAVVFPYEGFLDLQRDIANA